MAPKPPRSSSPAAPPTPEPPLRGLPSPRWARDLAAGLLVAGVLGSLAWAIVSGTAADNAAESDPADALSWRSAHPAALRSLATEHVQAGAGDNLRRAELHARSALRASPLGSEALSLLGLAADAREDHGRAGVLMNMAAKRSLRDRPAHAWLFEQHLASGRAERAWFHADMLLRTDKSVLEELSPFLMQLASQPGGAGPLAARLALSPRWRRGFLQELCARKADPAVLQTVFRSMQKTAAPPTPEELACWLRGLAEDGRYAEAYAAWVAFLPTERAGWAGPPYDGGFNAAPAASPFDWEIARDAGGEAVIAPSGDSRQGYALRVIPSSERRGAWIRQRLVLRPGPYVLTLASRSEQPGGTAPMRWTVRCAETQSLLGAAGPIETDTGWGPAAAAFDVPVAGCESQHLGLEAAPATLNQVESLAPVWFDDLRVTPRAALTARGPDPAVPDTRRPSF